MPRSAKQRHPKRGMKNTDKWFEVEYSLRGQSFPHYQEMGRYESAQQARQVLKEDYGGERVVHKVKRIRITPEEERAVAAFEKDYRRKTGKVRRF
jgi:hypothetical protein